MARVLIVGDAGEPRAVVELGVDYDDDGDALWVGRCNRPDCTWSMPERRQRWFEDAVREAEVHVDGCSA